MSNVLRITGRRGARWKPPLGLEYYDRSNPLIRNLDFVWLFNGPRYKFAGNIVGSANIAPNNNAYPFSDMVGSTTMITTASNYGPGLAAKFESANSDFYSCGETVKNLPFSVIVGVRQTNGQYIWNAGQSTNSNWYTIYSTGMACNDINGNVFTGLTGVASPEANEPYIIGATFAASNDRRLYYKGTLNNTSSTNVTPFTGAGWSTAIGVLDLDSFTGFLDGAVDFVYVWNRALTDLEHLLVAQDPFGFFQRPSSPNIIEALSAGGSLGVGLTRSVALGRRRLVG